MNKSEFLKKVTVQILCPQIENQELKNQIAKQLYGLLLKQSLYTTVSGVHDNMRLFVSEALFLLPVFFCSVS